MTTILHIDSSARTLDNSKQTHNSISRSLAHSFITLCEEKKPHIEIIYRDLMNTSLKFIDQAWLTAIFTPEEDRAETQNNLLLLSDELINEVENAEIIVLSTPMYNYGMPAVLKAWFDQIIRINKTFSFDLNRGDFPLKPIFSGKTMVLMTSSGEFGFQSGGVREKMNHLSPHIEVISQYLGVEQFYEISSEYQEFADERHELSLKNAQIEIANVFQKIFS